MFEEDSSGFDRSHTIPDEWESGAFSGLCVRGGLVIDAEWERGAVTSLSVTAKHDAECTLEYPTRDGVTAVKLSLKKGDRAEIVQCGQEY